MDTYDKFLLLCKKKGIKKTAALLEMGLSKATATKWKSGSMPSGDSLSRMSKYFNVPFEQLLPDNDDYPPAVTSGLITKEEYDDFVAPWGGMSEEMQHVFEWYYAYSKMSDECKVIARAMINSDKSKDSK